MDNNYFATTYTSPLFLKRENTVLKGGLCLSSLDYLNLYTTRHQFLHEKENHHLETLLYPKRKQSYLIGRYCAKNAISIGLEEINNQADFKSSYIENGILEQPIVISSLIKNTQVCISHTEFFGGAVAFPEAHPLGFDIEQLSPNKFEVIKTQMTINEQALVTPRFTYCHLWTAKEALSKILRCGFMVNMELLEIESHTESNTAFISYFKHFYQYKSLSFQIGQMVCSFVYPRKTELNIDIPLIKKIFEKKE